MHIDASPLHITHTLAAWGHLKCKCPIAVYIYINASPSSSLSENFEQSSKIPRYTGWLNLCHQLAALKCRMLALLLFCFSAFLLLFMMHWWRRWCAAAAAAADGNFLCCIERHLFQPPSICWAFRALGEGLITILECLPRVEDCTVVAGEGFKCIYIYSGAAEASLQASQSRVVQQTE